MGINWPLNSLTSNVCLQCLPQPSTASTGSLQKVSHHQYQSCTATAPFQTRKPPREMWNRPRTSAIFPTHIQHVPEIAQLRPLQFAASRENVPKHLDQYQYRKRGSITPSYQAFKPGLENFTHLWVKIAVFECEKLFKWLVRVTSWHPIKTSSTALTLYAIGCFSFCSKVSGDGTKKCEN